MASAFSISGSLSGRSFTSSRASAPCREIAECLKGQNRMPLNPSAPIIYLITSGETTSVTIPASEDFRRILHLVEAAASAKIDLLQIREKNLTAKVLFQLILEAKVLVETTTTRLLVNDRSDVALAAGADGVHLTTTSLEPEIVRRFGHDLLIGVSTHSQAEAQEARDGGADFAVYGPVFETESKRSYGVPVGLDNLRQSANNLKPFSLLAIGGVNLANVRDCFLAGAKGVAAINLFNDRRLLTQTVDRIREIFAETICSESKE